MEISDVVQRVLSGDRQAFAEVVRHYEGPLFRYLGRMGLRQERAEEIAQETFLRAWTRLGVFDSRRGSFSTWIYTIAHRLALNELGRESSRKEPSMLAEHEAATGRAGPTEALEADERRHTLRAALLELPAFERSAIALAYIEGLALADVARIEGCTVGAIKARLHRARRRLAKRLENELE